MRQRIFLSILLCVLAVQVSLSQDTSPPPLKLTIENGSIRIENPTDLKYHVDMFFTFWDDPADRSTLQPKDMKLLGHEATVIPYEELGSTSSKKLASQVPNMFCLNLISAEGTIFVCMFTRDEDDKITMSAEKSEELTALVKTIPGYNIPWINKSLYLGTTNHGKMKIRQ